jgi:hypothetical protein
MKKIIITLLSTMLLFVCQLSAQVPQAFNYQAVARNSSGVLISNKSIGIKINIHQVSASGTVVYSETFTPTTNQFGLFTLPIGQGAPVTGVFSTINWSTGNYYLQVEIDPSGGASYTDMGTSQLLTVPYAMYAASGVNGATGPTGPAGSGETGSTGPIGPTGPTGPSTLGMLILLYNNENTVTGIIADTAFTYSLLSNEYSKILVTCDIGTDGRASDDEATFNIIFGSTIEKSDTISPGAQGTVSAFSGGEISYMGIQQSACNIIISINPIVGAGPFSWRVYNMRVYGVK